VGLEDILAAIRADTDAEVADVLALARGEVSTIEAQARIDGERAAADILRTAEDSARTEADQIVIRARTAVQRRLALAGEDEYRRTLDRLREELRDLRSTPRYRAVLDALLDEALGRLPQASVVLVDPRDTSLAADLVGGRDGPAPRVEGSLATMGGVSVATDDGRSVHNTFEVRMERADGVLRTIATRHTTATGSTR